MSNSPFDPDLDPYLAERLAETRDHSVFKRRPMEPSEITRESEFSGPEHLGGRKIKDRFIRGGARPVEPPQNEIAKESGLESHLKSRLDEVSDRLAWRSSDPASAALERYRQIRRGFGGAP